jgi:hypothetical protein
MNSRMAKVTVSYSLDSLSFFESTDGKLRPKRILRLFDMNVKLPRKIVSLQKHQGLGSSPTHLVSGVEQRSKKALED